MSIESILAQLKAERHRLDLAIAALEGVTQPADSVRAAAAKPIKRRSRRLTAKVRRRLSEAKKAWWANKKAKSSGKRQNKTA